MKEKIKTNNLALHRQIVEWWAGVAMTRYPSPRSEKPQQDGMRGEFAFRIKPHSCHRCLEGLKQTLCAPAPRDPRPRDPETETELCLSISCGRMGQQWTSKRTGTLGAADLGMA